MTTLYYCSFAIYSFVSVLYRTVYGSLPNGSESPWAILSKILTGTIAFLLIIKIILQTYTKRQLVLVGVLGVLVLINLLVSRWTLMVWLFLFVVAAKGVSVRRLARCSAIVIIPITVITILLALSGCIENYQVVNVAGRTTLLGGISRYSLGFIHPNAFASVSLEIMLSLMVLTEKRRKAVALVTSVLIGVAVYAVTDSRGLLLVIFVVLLLQCASLVGKDSLKRWVLNGAVIAYIIVVSFTFLTAVLYDPSNKLLIMINKVMSNRIVFPHDFLMQGLLSPFGTAESLWPSRPNALGVDQFVIDNSFFFSVAAFGMVLGGLLLVSLLFFLLKMKKEDNLGPTAIGFTAFLAMGFMERTMLMVCINYFIIGICCLLYGCRISTLDDDKWPADGPNEISLRGILSRKKTLCAPKHQALADDFNER